MALSESVTANIVRLRDRLSQRLAKSDGLGGLLGQAAKPDLPSPSVIIEYIVPSNKNWAFRSWHRRIVKSAQRSPGFLRADRYRPLAVQEGCLKWYTVLHFEQPDQLRAWLNSSDRESLLQAGRDIFTSYKFTSFETGMQGWFSNEAGAELNGLGPPAWKEILAVVLGLYPIIMVQGFILERLGLFDDWDPASAMLANNLITTCVFTLVVMPRIVRWLNFWLRPAHRGASVVVEVLGTVVTVLAMAAMVYVFNEIA